MRLLRVRPDKPLRTMFHPSLIPLFLALVHLIVALCKNDFAISYIATLVIDFRGDGSKFVF